MGEVVSMTQVRAACLKVAREENVRIVYVVVTDDEVRGVFSSFASAAAVAKAIIE